MKKRIFIRTNYVFRDTEQETHDSTWILFKMLSIIKNNIFFLHYCNVLLAHTFFFFNFFTFTRSLCRFTELKLLPSLKLFVLLKNPGVRVLFTSSNISVDKCFFFAFNNKKFQIDTPCLVFTSGVSVAQRTTQLYEQSIKTHSDYNAFVRQCRC